MPSGGGDVYINGAEGGLDGKYTISGTGAVSTVGEKPYVITGTGSVSALEGKENTGSGGFTSQPGQGVVTVSGGSYTFNGSGWGHQVGMSQYGANAMARRGFTFDQIVAFYFPGVQVAHY